VDLKFRNFADVAVKVVIDRVSQEIDLNVPPISNTPSVELDPLTPIIEQESNVTVSIFNSSVTYPYNVKTLESVNLDVVNFKFFIVKVVDFP